MSKIIALIPARGGSKGVRRKNIRQLAGKPLIEWTIGEALRCPSISRLIVSTDDEEIAQVARGLGAEVPFLRPPGIALDTTAMIEVALHALHWIEGAEGSLPEYLLLLQPTSPFRTVYDIEAVLGIARQNQPPAVVSVVEAKHHPYLTKTVTSGGTLADFVEHNFAYTRRQDLPPAYCTNGALYLNRPESLLQDRTFLPNGTYPYIMPPERSLDIDSPWDFSLAELLLSDQKAAP
jgi:CMP-N,N'-diacetyllegionaminic acid synthase